MPTSVPRQAPPRPATRWVGIPFDADQIRCNAHAAFSAFPANTVDAAGEVWLDIVRARFIAAHPHVTEWLPVPRLAAITAQAGHLATVEATLWLEAAAREDLTPQDVAVVAARVGVPAEVTLP